MSDDDRPSRNDSLEVGDTDAEFELDVEVLVEMRKKEAELIAQQQEDERRKQQLEQQLALQHRYRQLQEEQLRREKEQQAAAAEERMSDEEIDTPRLIRDVSSMSTMSTTSTASTSAELGKGYVTVVDVRIQPHRLSPRSSMTADTPLVDVRMHVFQRFVPHLATAALTIRRVSQSHAQYIKQMEAEEGYSSDTSSEGTEDEADEEQAKPLHLTGDRQIDAAMLRKLIGVASDDSDTESDSELRAVNSTRTTMPDDEEDEEGVSAVLPLRTKHELPPAAVPPVPPFTVSPTDSLVPCGAVTAIVDSMVIVQCHPGGRALDLGSAVCTFDRTALGRVDEVFGPVSEPMYSIRPLEGVDVVKSGLVEGMRVYSVPSQSSYVLPDTTPGSDASNLFDEEVEVDLQEYSDDEKEQHARSTKKKGKAKGRNNAVAQQSNSGRVLPQEPASKSPRYRFAPSSGQQSLGPPPAAAAHHHPSHNPHIAPIYYQPPHLTYGHPPHMYGPSQPQPPQAQFTPPAYGHSPYNVLQRPLYQPGLPHFPTSESLYSTAAPSYPPQPSVYTPTAPAGGVSGWQYQQAVQQPQAQAHGSGAAR